MKQGVSYRELFGRYIACNMKAGMEYRTSFWIQIFGMVINNASFIVFWSILYARVGDINGYGLNDVMFLWALAAIGFGLCQLLAGNWNHISRIIYQGELDVYLLQPRSILPNLLASRMVVSGWGDVTYGILLFVLFQSLTLQGILLFLLFTLLFGMLFASMAVLAHSLTFFLGNADSAASPLVEAMISFTLYPGSIFRGTAKVLLMTLVPTVWAAYVPVELFSEFSAGKFALLIGVDVLFLLAALLVFRLGLRRYESGNRIGTRL